MKRKKKKICDEDQNSGVTPEKLEKLLPATFTPIDLSGMRSREARHCVIAIDQLQALPVTHQ